MLSIVSTTINSPTTATLKFCKIAQDKKFKFIVVGDLKTPHQEYVDLSRKYGWCGNHFGIQLQPTRRNERICA